MDRFFRGFLAGAAGGVAMNLWTLVAVFILQWNIIRFIDWAAVVLYGRFPVSHLEGAFALWMQLIWVGLLGIIFAFLIPQVTSQAYLLKGALYGVIVGFITYAVPTMLQVPALKFHSLETVVSNLTGGLIWGLTMAKTLHWLDKKIPAK